MKAAFLLAALLRPLAEVQEDPLRPAWAAKGGTRPSNFSVHEENDSFAVKRSDADYTQGLRLQLQFEPVGEGLRDRGLPVRPGDGPEEPLDPLFFPHLFYGEDPLRVARFGGGLACAQLLYTPKDLLLRTVDPEDRPYAAWIYMGLLTIVTDRPREGAPRWQDVWELDLGVIGPAALGEEIQPFIHRLLRIDRPTWVEQLPNEPTLMLGYDRRWMVELVQFDIDGERCDAHLVPHVGVRLGSPLTEVTAGGRLAVGWNTPRQFNVGSQMAVHSAFTPVHATGEPVWWSIYVFGGAEGRAVLRDTFLDGTLFRDSVRVNRTALVTDLTYGLGFRFGWTTFTVGQVHRSAEVRADSGFHNFGFVELAIELGF